MTHSDRRVLVTGGSGFLGRQALAPLLDRGFEVHAVSRQAARAGGPVRWHQADLLDGESPKQLCDAVSPSHLLHLAWQVEHGVFWESPENFDWLAASVLLFRAFAEAGGRRIVGAGTCVEYAPSDAPLREDASPCAPVSLYARAKHACHQALRACAADHRLSYAWGRVFFPYGEGGPPGKLVASTARRLQAGLAAPLNNPDLEHDFIDSRDVGAAFAALAESKIEGPVNIGTGQATKIGEVAAILGRLAGRPDLIVKSKPGEGSPADQSPLVADVRRLTREVNFRPQHDLQSGLAHAFDWWRRHDESRQDDSACDGMTPPRPD